MEGGLVQIVIFSASVRTLPHYAGNSGTFLHICVWHHICTLGPLCYLRESYSFIALYVLFIQFADFPIDSILAQLEFIFWYLLIELTAPVFGAAEDRALSAA